MGNGSDGSGWIRVGWAGLGLSLLLAGGAWASPGDEGVTGEAWQSGHMASQYRSLLAEPTKAPELRGSARYDEIAAGATATPGTVPPESIETTTQHSWESGPSRAPGKRSRLGSGPNKSIAGKATGPRRASSQGSPRGAHSNRSRGRSIGGR
ncbi:MAG: hypothetical protein GY937_14310 [bacterium]|nr:hypothetical protein [bacterium]